MKIGILGAGNVAVHLVAALVEQGHTVCVWNRSEDPLSLFRQKNLCCSTSMNDVLNNTEINIICVKDSAIGDVARQLHETTDNTKAVVAHTSGSTPMAVVENFFENCGVIYPMQTFSRHIEPNFSEIPFFIEANNPASADKLKLLASSMSDLVFDLDSRQREMLHLACVFACNFTTHNFSIAEKLLKEIGLPFSVVLPLVNETIRKANLSSPGLIQTGPAVREDHATLKRHQQLLKTLPDELEIYRNMSQNIMKYKHHKNSQQND
ncbi:MAG: DUF2520 domain-containing protein [Prevotellaceae bacterium]|nr:DUF2520 domain-containing protein [Prevotellaceae bacterium]